MKKLFIAVLLLLSAAAGFAAAQLQIKTEQARTITQYVGAPIARYDLGDTECFVENTSRSLFCLRK